MMKPARLRELFELEPGDGRYGRDLGEPAAES